MNKIFRLLILFSILALLRGFPQAPQPWQSKVDDWVLSTAAEDQTEFLVMLQTQADLKQANQFGTKAEKGAFVYQRLTETATRTQKSILQMLANEGERDSSIQYRSYWVANMIWVRGDLALIEKLARRADVAHLYANPAVKMQLPQPTTELLLPEAPEVVDTIYWNIDLIQAPEVWAAGYTGQGAVVAGQDTGYDWDHPALINQYRGWDGSQADHNYNWHDAIHEDFNADPNPCGYDLDYPCDDHGHGTHTMGTMVGDDGGTNQIGVAPGARWIGCRNMEEGIGRPETYIECFQWFIAPTDLNDENPRPDLAPDVINNSWGCPTTEGCAWDSLLAVVRNVRAAGIVIVQSAGNYGYEGCYSVKTPSNIYDEVFTVGSTDRYDVIAGDSSRGPVSVDGSYRLKPDISAPGVGIYSCIPGTSYASWSGTSMAAPHVAGQVALLLSGQPALRGQVDQIEDLIRFSAVPRSLPVVTCGSIPAYQVPNNIYGYGRIDAWNAFQDLPHLFLIHNSTEGFFVPPDTTITYTLQITYWHPLDLTYNVVLTDVLPVGSNFVFATSPYTSNGNTIRWDFASLAVGASQTVKLAVQLPGPAGVYPNQFYGVHSDEVPFTTGPVIWTFVGQALTLLPFIH